MKLATFMETAKMMNPYPTSMSAAHWFLINAHINKLLAAGHSIVWIDDCATHYIIQTTDMKGKTQYTQVDPNKLIEL